MTDVLNYFAQQYINSILLQFLVLLLIITLVYYVIISIECKKLEEKEKLEKLFNIWQQKPVNKNDVKQSTED